MAVSGEQGRKRQLFLYLAVEKGVKSGVSLFVFFPTLATEFSWQHKKVKNIYKSCGHQLVRAGDDVDDRSVEKPFDLQRDLHKTDFYPGGQAVKKTNTKILRSLYAPKVPAHLSVLLRLNLFHATIC